MRATMIAQIVLIVLSAFDCTCIYVKIKQYYRLCFELRDKNVHLELKRDASSCLGETFHVFAIQIVLKKKQQEHQQVLGLLPHTAICFQIGT